MKALLPGVRMSHPHSHCKEENYTLALGLLGKCLYHCRDLSNKKASPSRSRSDHSGCDNKSGKSTGSSLKFETGNSYSILHPRSLQHCFKNWNELRKHKLTASTFAGAVGFWPRRRAQLWLEKLGAIEPFSGNISTGWNNIKEEVAIEKYELITGNTVLVPEFQVYAQDNWLAASPDGIIDQMVNGLHSRGILEIKCPVFCHDMKITSPWSRVPIYCIPQAQGLMEIMDRDWLDFYVWTPNGSNLFRIYRNIKYWQVLKVALSDFWWNHVQPARELCSKCVITNPLIELKSLRPSPKHELFRDIICESKRVVDNCELLTREFKGVLQP